MHISETYGNQIDSVKINWLFDFRFLHEKQQNMTWYLGNEYIFYLWLMLVNHIWKAAVLVINAWTTFHATCNSLAEGFQTLSIAGNYIWLDQQYAYQSAMPALL